MNSPGQPTSYKTEYRALARNYCLLGATNEELAGFFEVSPRTIDNWIASRPEFAGAVREGRLHADADVVSRLYERAMGYVQTIERRELYRGEEKVITSTVHYPPDTNACMFWLRNRQPKKWRHRAEIAADEASTADFLAALEAAGERARNSRREMRSIPGDTACQG
jgi:hypothetical protein